MSEVTLTSEQKQLVRKHSKEFRDWINSNEGKKSVQEHRDHEKYLQEKLSPENIDKINEKDFAEIYGKLWVSKKWGNNKDWSVTNQIIRPNSGVEKIIYELKRLLYGSNEFADRYNTFIKNVKGIRISSLSEILNFIFPDKFCLWNITSKNVLYFLGLDMLLPNNIMRKDNWSISGEEYSKCVQLVGSIKNESAKFGIEDFIDIDIFFWHIHSDIIPLIRRESSEAKPDEANKSSGMYLSFEGIKLASRSYPDEVAQKAIREANDEVNQFLKRFPFNKHPELIDNLRQEDLFQKDIGFLHWIAFKEKSGGLGTRSADFVDRAKQNWDRFKQLLKIAVDPSKTLIEKVDAHWEEIPRFGGDKTIAKKIIYLYNSDRTLPIYSSNDSERFLKKFEIDYLEEAKRNYGKNYTNLTLGERYDLLTKMLLRIREDLNPNWDIQTFSKFLYHRLKLPKETKPALDQHDKLSSQVNVEDIPKVINQFKIWLNSEFVQKRTNRIQTEKKEVKDIMKKLDSMDKSSIEFTDLVLYGLLPHRNTRFAKRVSAYPAFRNLKQFFISNYNYNDQDWNKIAINVYTLVKKFQDSPENLDTWIRDFTSDKVYSRGFQCGAISPILFCINDSFPVINKTVIESYNDFAHILDLDEIASPKLDSYIGSMKKCKELMASLANNEFINDFTTFDNLCYWYISTYKKNKSPLEQSITVEEVPEDEILSIEDVSRLTYFQSETIKEIADLLQDKKQIIFYGPPGTSKTYLAMVFGRYFAGSRNNVEIIQFHPSYSYEDFIEGIKPNLSETGEAKGFSRQSGLFKTLVEKCLAYPDKDLVLIIDEINRGNISKIFGELIYLLEYRKEKISLTYSPKKEFAIPENLYIIGTMNSADRSIASLDYALRRRFYFIDFYPEINILRGWFKGNPTKIDAEKVIGMLEQINEIIGAEVGKEYQICQSYLMVKDLDEIKLKRIIGYAIMPLVRQYFFSKKQIVDKINAICKGTTTYIPQS